MTTLVRSSAAKAKSFTDLIAWKEGHKLVLMVYRMTKKFPKDELFGLTSQMRRAAVSITSNLAEGFNRQSKPDKIRFYFMSLGSVSEIQNQSLVARDISLMNQQEFTILAEQSVIVSKLIKGLVRSIKSPATSYQLPATA